MKRLMVLLMLVASVSLFAACSNNAEQKKPEENKADTKTEQKADGASDNADKKQEAMKDEKKEDADKKQDGAAQDSQEAEKKEEPAVKEGYRAGNLAKDVEFELWEDGKVVKLSDYKGQPVVLNFWASWCPHCVHELPALNEAYKEYKDKGLKVITVNLSFQDDLNSAKKAMEKVGADFIMVSDNTGAATSAFGVRGIPANVFIDKDGIIYDNKAGAMDQAQFSEYMKAITE